MKPIVNPVNIRDQRLFQLTTAHSSYWFRVTEHGHLEHLHHGVRLPLDQDPNALAVKRTSPIGPISYDESDPLYSLDQLPLEWSGAGVGDYRQPPLQIRLPNGSRVSDFTFVGASVIDGDGRKSGIDGDAEPGPGPEDDSVTLPRGFSDGDDCQTLRIELVDAAAQLSLTLEYVVFADCDVIARQVCLRNNGPETCFIESCASMMVDLPQANLEMISLHGAWIKEAHAQTNPLTYGIVSHGSTLGWSSARNNPGLLLVDPAATETTGRAFGYNLIYSGNHLESVERSTHDLLRISLGINPEGFNWALSPGSQFTTPQAIMTCSNQGIGAVSRQFHDFVNHHLVPRHWQERPRPIVYNNWEATFFDFTAGKLMKLARQAKDLGVETFVLDDGWFGERRNDSAGLGDYTVNRHKFPRGLPAFADQIRGLGLDFGLWVEPEMVNPDSDLFRAHPDWAISTPGREQRLGRHQLVLDLTSPEVRDYIVEQVGGIIDATGATYIKWDCNRPISDAYSPTLTASTQGEFNHRQIIGLYQVLDRIFGPRPQVLLESCASGGNRFDLGMLAFSPQVWSSDDTDPIERLAIQGGLSLFYPPSSMGAHVSQSPHQQTLRSTPLTTRFNVAAFGDLGYEFNLNELTAMERLEIKEQIEFYKQHRMTLQFGRHYRGDRDLASKDNKVVWTMVASDGHEAITGLFQTEAHASEGLDRLSVDGLEADAAYRLETRPQSLFVGRFGGLLKHVLPVELNPNGRAIRLIDQHYRLTDAVEQYQATGGLLADGLNLNNQFIGAGYNAQLRMLGDFGSNLYLISRLAPPTVAE
ncbi:MAG: alpha-galactosidase [Propionibacteriaceae bacterium]|jgi:alpha-galactosidase|nr:alpha-galactosidase [Propionibacteriaceae bacterium]